MSDFWQSLAVSAYESANAWRTQAIAASLTVTDLNPLEAYSNYQKAIADYREAESAYLNALIDNGGIGGGGGSSAPLPHADTHATGQSDALTPGDIGAVPTTRAVNTGTGLTGGGGLNADRTLSLTNTSVTAASYGSITQTPTVTIDAQGRITSASNNTITPQNIGACELTDGLIPINRLPPLAITDRFTAASDAAMIALSAQMGDICFRSDQGRYYQKVNTEGLVTDWVAWLEPPVLSVNGLNGDVVLTPDVVGSPPNARNIATGTGLTGGGDLSADRTLSLANTAVTAGTYGSATQSNSITVDAQGRVTAASQATISVAYANVTNYDLGIQTFSFGSGWEIYAVGWDCSYKKLGGLVSFSGGFKRTTTTGTTIATLPVGYRPPKNCAFILTGWVTSGNWEVFTVYVRTTGVLELVNPMPSSSIFWLPVDSINYTV